MFPFRFSGSQVHERRKRKIRIKSEMNKYIFQVSLELLSAEEMAPIKTVDSMLSALTLFRKEMFLVSFF